jgi:hypothetical protein
VAKAESLTPKQLEILQHAFGVDQYGRGEMYRNHFCAGGSDEAICRELVGMGYMHNFEREWLPYYNCVVTEAGKVAMRAESPKPPKLSRSQLRYERFLDADTGESFREWLRRGAEVPNEL